MKFDPAQHAPGRDVIGYVRAGPMRGTPIYRTRPAPKVSIEERRPLEVKIKRALPPAPPPPDPRIGPAVARAQQLHLRWKVWKKYARGIDSALSYVSNEEGLDLALVRRAAKRMGLL